MVTFNKQIWLLVQHWQQNYEAIISPKGAQADFR